MNIKEFANILDGRDYGHEIIKQEEDKAKELGFIVVFGYSDDNAEFRGAIDDEVGCYDGGEIFLDKNGLFEDCECECKHSVLARLNCKVINALWCNPTEPDHQCTSWTFETDIPHETFNIFEDSEIFCKGIIFSIKDL